MTRRGLFSSLFGIAVGSTTVSAPQRQEDNTLQQLDELHKSVLRLRTQMEKPIHLKIVLDDKVIAKSVVNQMKLVGL